MGALPELAPVGENHLLRSTSVVQKVAYGQRRIAYQTFDHGATEVLCLAFRPARVTAGGAELPRREDLKAAGYTVEALTGSDCIVGVRHENSDQIVMEGRA